ncbi:hypothetical protein [Micromonospora lupini]|uniref:hypothetical protein n=1 Tax=Micromonospora lupini TaxID=285679 RepID=UPI0033E6F967
MSRARTDPPPLGPGTATEISTSGPRTKEPALNTHLHRAALPVRPRRNQQGGLS